jgi:hypothetical protein
MKSEANQGIEFELFAKQWSFSGCLPRRVSFKLACAATLG